MPGAGSSFESARGAGRARLEDLESLYGLTDAVARASSVDDVCRATVDVARAALEVERLGILLRDGCDATGYRAWVGLSEGLRAATETYLPWPADATPAAVAIEDVADDASLGDLRPALLAEGVRALALVPLVVGRGLLGTLVLAFGSAHRFAESELRLATAIAAAAAGAIERLRMEEALRASRDQLGAVLQSLEDGIIVHDRRGRLVFANDTAARLGALGSAGGLLEAPAGGIVPASRIMDEHGRPLAPEQLPAPRVLAGAPSAETVVRYQAIGSSEEAWATIRTSRVLDAEGRLQYAVTVIRDITEERRAARRQEFRARANSALGTTLELPTLLDVVASLAVPELADWCAVHLLDRGAMRLAALAHVDPERAQTARELAERYPPELERDDDGKVALRTEHRRFASLPEGPALVGNARDPVHLELLREAEVGSSIVVPISGSAGLAGSLTLVTTGRSDRRGDDLALTQELAAAAALAIENGRLHAAERQARETAENAVQRLAKLARITDVTLRASSVYELLEGLLRAVQEALGSDRATILLREGQDELVVRAAVGIDEETALAVRVPMGEGIAGRIAASRTPIVVEDLSRVDVVSAYLREQGGSLAGVPLVFRDRVLGVLHVSSDRTAAFGVDDLSLLNLAAERAAIALEQTRLFERERDIAAALQRSLLPERFPRLPGVAVVASYLPASDGTRVGGDWYDPFPLGDGRIALAIGDVVGHGIEAAAAMGQVRNALRAYAIEDPSPATVFARLNNLLTELSERDFCTAFLGVIDPWAWSIVYANAGHPPPLVVDASGTSRFLEGARSTPLGALPGAPFEETTEALGPGSVLFAYTDGLVETRGESLDGRLEQLAGTVAGAAASPFRRLPGLVTAELASDAASQLDDVAIIALQLAASDELHLRVPAEPSSLVVVRRALDAFLARAGATEEETFELKVACGEACANVVEHAYRSGTGVIRVSGSQTKDGVELTVRDSGSWRTRRTRGARGRGLALMRALADEVEIRSQAPTGTEVTIRRRIAAGA